MKKKSGSQGDSGLKEELLQPKNVADIFEGLNKNMLIMSDCAKINKRFLLMKKSSLYIFQFMADSILEVRESVKPVKYNKNN